MRGTIFLLLALAALSLQANAISVASDYLANDTLVLKKGESKIYSIRLQNPADYEVSLKLEYDNTFMKAIDYKEIYILAPKETGYSILFNVTAPRELGVYKVGYTVSEVEPSGGGGLPIRLKINKTFNLKVIKNPNKFYINYDYAAYAVIALAFLFYVFRKKRVRKSLRRKSRKFL